MPLDYYVDRLIFSERFCSVASEGLLKSEAGCCEIVELTVVIGAGFSLFVKS
jgi:hypothetical protein